METTLPCIIPVSYTHLYEEKNYDHIQDSFLKHVYWLFCPPFVFGLSSELYSCAKEGSPVGTNFMPSSSNIFLCLTDWCEWRYSSHFGFFGTDLRSTCADGWCHGLRRSNWYNDCEENRDYRPSAVGCSIPQVCAIFIPFWNLLHKQETGFFHK